MFLPSIILHLDEKQDPDSSEKTDEFKWDMKWKQKTICCDGEKKLL